MPAALDAALHIEVSGAERLLALADPALREACEPLSTPSYYKRLSVPLFVALPQNRPGFGRGDAEAVRSRLAAIPDLPVTVSGVVALQRGHASGLALLESAREQMVTGGFDACLVGGVDSYFHPDTMEWLDDNRQLASARGRSAFVPGEAAAFCLLGTERLLVRLGVASLARLRSVAVGTEEKTIKTDDVCLGAGLTAVVDNALRGAAIGPTTATTVNTVICDINGERYRGEEWGFVCLRTASNFDDPAGYWSPADCWGDVGAASGPLFIMLACQMALRGHATGPVTLVWASSEDGLRAAVVLETAVE